MLLQALLDVAPARGEVDRAALVVHSVMLDHGFICVGTREPEPGTRPTIVAGADGALAAQLLPPDWNAAQDSFSFGYIHPLQAAEETYTLKALFIGGLFAVHAASSKGGSEVLSVNLDVAADASFEGDEAVPAFAARAQAWQEKVAANIVLRLLNRTNSTSRFARALAQDEGQGTKRRATEASAPQPPRAPARPEIERPPPEFRPPPDFQPEVFPPRHPDFPGISEPRFFWTPSGGGSLLGPRHPAWGQVFPPRRGDGVPSGLLPRFDPIGPGMGEPDPDHLRVPGNDPFGQFPPAGFPGGRPGGSGIMDPDGMFRIV